MEATGLTPSKHALGGTSMQAQKVPLSRHYP